MSNLPLQGIKAVEIADGVAGPYCGRLLAALGAEVVKIEIPPHGDSSRNTSPFIKNSICLHKSLIYESKKYRKIVQTHCLFSTDNLTSSNIVV